MSSPAEAGRSAAAWLLDFGGGKRAAVGERELQEVLVRPDLTPRPDQAPAVLQGTLRWRDMNVPVLDLGLALGLRGATAGGWVTIAAFRERPDAAVRFGALVLAAAPVLTRVSDDMGCSLPEDCLREYLVWSYLGLSCFKQQETVIPILALERLFSESGQQRLDRFCASTAAPPRAVAEEEHA